MEGSVLSFLKAEWKVSDTGWAHWASSFFYFNSALLWKIFRKVIRTIGPSDYRAFGLLVFRTIGLLGIQTIVPSDYWAFGLSGLRIIGPLDYRTLGTPDYWSLGPLGLRTIGPSDYRAFGLLGLRTIGDSDYRAFGLLGRRRLITPLVSANFSYSSHITWNALSV